jgi:hypothetical protein
MLVVDRGVLDTELTVGLYIELIVHDVELTV